ncbi:Paf1-domain-containing protein [Lophium mytilinum]|uniref:Paf1-domain-containing protein n=1 Tax=Lophium mytilinum TaxID=390894 RepID=A0A6A6R6I5_9PEZI|nr:Paf1-domain-containing protein [Lophium mytilinum]
MANSSSRPTYHQDYIARIRYSNALPPPPCPPKLLEIPNTGLASGQYTSAGFASRLAREQPLNIEADAELGMPIDLVGLPGVFDGNESAIHFLDTPPVLHPRDALLIRPLASIGKPASGATGVSFLRRTEYITSAAGGGSRFESSSSSNTVRARSTKRRRADMSKDDPIHIIRSIAKGFDLAYPQDAYLGPDSSANIRAAEITPEERKAWRQPVHPMKPDVKLLDSYPILPDLNAIPDGGAYMILKFNACPVKASDKYDERIDVAVLRPLDPTPELLERLKAQQAEAEVDPSRPPPEVERDYEFFLPSNADKVRGIKRNFGVLDPDNVDFDNDDEPPTFRYDRVRAFETHKQSGDANDAYSEQVALVLHDPDAQEPQRTEPLQKAAYYYPIRMRTLIRPQRPGIGGRLQQSQSGGEPEEKVDQLLLRGTSPAAENAEARAEFVAKYDMQVPVEG